MLNLSCDKENQITMSMCQSWNFSFCPHAHTPTHSLSHTHFHYTHTHTQLFATKPFLEEGLSEEDLISSSTSSRRGSMSSVDTTGELDPQMRRRSSTSDVLRFRQMLQPKASSAYTHEVTAEMIRDSENSNTNNSVEMKADLMGASLPTTTLQDKEDSSYYVTPKLQMAADRSLQLQRVREDSTHSGHVAALTTRSYDSGSLSIVYDM